MRVPVKGIQPGEYAEMIRTGNEWTIQIGDSVVSVIPNKPPFSTLGRSQYKLLGLENEEARVIRYAPLHRHSDYSLLDGMTQIPEMVKWTEYAGALTDHGNMYGFLAYYKEMKAANKKPILGFEGYMEDMDGKLTGNHVILLAKNTEGAFNLFKLTSEAYDNFRYKPHVTWELLKKYSNGVICLSACLGGLLPNLIKERRLDDARLAAKKFISIFGIEDFYIEIQRHEIREELAVNRELILIAKELGLKVVATTDAHYPTKEDAYPHEILLCIQTGKTLTDEGRMGYDGTGYWLMNSEEVEDLFSDMPEILDNTLDVADKCDVTLNLGDVNLPAYTIPKRFETPMDYMEHLTMEGYDRHFKGTPLENDPIYRDRLKYELDMIRQMGFASYFIIVWDFINYCRTHNIYVGPGRGSAAGSLVAYCLGITDLDPIKYKLLFERFLNPERVSWPDIDTDIEYSRRPEVIQYITKKYGAGNVCRIVTFGTMAAKMVLKDVGRVLGETPGYTAKLANAIPTAPGMTIEKALEMSPDFKSLYETDPRAKEIIDIGKRLEGNKRHSSLHACGLVISPSAVSDFLPTSMEIDKETKERSLSSQVTMSEVEELSLIKMDLLGLKTMGVIHEVVDTVQRNYGKEAVLNLIGTSRDEFHYQDIPLNDRKVYQMLARGETGAVFQLESGGMTKLITQMFADIDTLPDDRLDECFERLIAAVALYRPGPMDYIPNYLDGMRDVHNIKYLTPELEDILRPTYGVIVYQEQVMQIVQKLAGYTLGRADVVRKAMGKKKHKIMDAEKVVFIHGNKSAFETGKDQNYAPGCVANGIPEDIAVEIWSQMESFASYAFNRSHAACYALLACITAYMRCYWPAEFYAAMCNAFIANSDKLHSYFSQATHLGIKLLSPDVNKSGIVFTAEKDGIRYGLGGISGIKGQAEEIVGERKNGEYKSVKNLFDRMAGRDSMLTKTVIEGLVYSGALSSFSQNKNSLLQAFPILQKAYKATATDRALGQISMFGNLEEEEVSLPAVPAMDRNTELRKEQEVLGVFLSGHPAQEIAPILSSNKDGKTLEELSSMGERKYVRTGGMIQNVRVFYTKNGEKMAVFELQSQFSTLSCVVFPSNMIGCEDQLIDQSLVIIDGSYVKDRNGEGMQFLVNSIESKQAYHGMTNPFVVTIHSKAEQQVVLDYIKKYPGPHRVVLRGNGKEVELKSGVNMTLATLNYLSGEFQKNLSA